MGAVFNRDYPGNRGRRPLPPTINYNLNDIEFHEVSYERRRWPEKRPVYSKNKLRLYGVGKKANIES